MTISRRTMLMAGAALPGTLTFPQLTNAQVFSAEGRYEVLPAP